MLCLTIDLDITHHFINLTSMKDIARLILICLFGATGAALPVIGFYLFWSWCTATVGTTTAYAGLIKVGITLACILVGGGATVGLAFLGGMLALMLAILIFG